jgi:hypothetical protein
MPRPQRTYARGDGPPGVVAHRVAVMGAADVQADRTARVLLLTIDQYPEAIRNAPPAWDRGVFPIGQTQQCS